MDNSEILNRLFFALADPTRRDILSRLVEAEFSIGELAENYEMSLPAISKHLQVLQDAEIIHLVKMGRSKIAKLEADNLVTAQIWLSTLSDESAIFDRLETEIENLTTDDFDLKEQGAS